MAEKPQPVRVLYCQVCSLPPEYCEFGGSDFEKCKPWLIQNVPDLYPNLLNGIILFFLISFILFINYYYYNYNYSCWFCVEANEKEVGKVADTLQGTGISSAASCAGAASSGFYFFIFMIFCNWMLMMKNGFVY